MTKAYTAKHLYIALNETYLEPKTILSCVPFHTIQTHQDTHTNEESNPHEYVASSFRPVRDEYKCNCKTFKYRQIIESLKLLCYCSTPDETDRLRSE
jgi:hypothetical protein